MQKLTIGIAFLWTILFVIALELLGISALLNIFVPMDVGIETYLVISNLIELLSRILLLVIIYFGLKRFIFENNLRPIKIENLDLNYLTIAILSGIGMLYIQPFIEIVFSLIPGFPPHISYSVKSENLEFWLVLSLITRVVIIPISEELFFRGFILKGLMSKYSPVIAVIASAILFGLIHFYWFDPSMLGIRTVFIVSIGGLIAGFLYVKSGKLLYPITFHVSWNLFVHMSYYIDFPFI